MEKWQAFLNRLCDGDQRMIDFLQRELGRALVARSVEKADADQVSLDGGKLLA